MNHKDQITLYMLRNYLATLLVAFTSMILSFIHFYQCTFVEAFQRLLVFDIYTLLYFILLWVFDYLVFEISKIVYDMYEEKVTFIPSIVLLVSSVFIYILPIRDLFQYNFTFLCLLIIVRMVKEMWRRSPQLFTGIKEFISDIKLRLKKLLNEIKIKLKKLFVEIKTKLKKLFIDIKSKLKK